MRAISGPADRSPEISAPTVKARVPAPVSTMAAASVMFQFVPQPTELGEHRPCHHVEAQLIIDRDDRDMAPVSCEADFHQTGSRSIRPVPYTRRETKGEPDEGDAMPRLGRARCVAAGRRPTARAPVG